MVAVVISPNPVLQFFINGIPATGGLLFTYSGGTSFKTNTYTDSTGTVANANPIVLNANGEAPNIWIPPQTAIKYVFAPAGDTDPPSAAIWTIDNVVGAPTNTGTIATQNANNVNITGGTISVGTLTCTGTTNLSVLNGSNATFAGIVVAGNSTFKGPVALQDALNAGGIITMTAAAGQDSALISDASSGHVAYYLMQNAGSDRWDIKKDSAPEVGANAGSDFSIDRYDDTGTPIDSPIHIVRSTGVVNFTNGITINGGAASAIGSVSNFNAAVNIAAGATVTSDRGLKFTGASNSAGASTGTLNNAPAATDPTFWLKIAINGSNYSIPCWSA